MEPSDRRIQEILADFEARGVDGVRDALSREIFGSSLKIHMAEAWLEKQQRGHAEAEVLDEARKRAALTAEPAGGEAEAREGNRLARKAIRAANVANAVAAGAFLLAAIALARSMGWF